MKESNGGFRHLDAGCPLVLGDEGVAGEEDGLLRPVKQEHEVIVQPRPGARHQHPHQLQHHAARHRVVAINN